MLVLAMEFSRCALRARRTSDIKEQTDERVDWARARGRPARMAPDSIASEGGIASGLPERAGSGGRSLKTE